MEKKVLLIDDEAAIRRNLTVALMQKGFEIEPCENGICALNKLETFRKKGINVDYVVTDIKLPDIDGIKLLKVIKSQYPEIPVVVITGFGDENTLKEIEMEKGDGYLDKPFNPDQLTDIFNSITDKKEKTQVVKQIDPDKLKEEKAVSAYTMMKIRSREDFVELYRDLYFMDNVLYCDAVRGEYDIILLLQADSTETIEKIVREKIMVMDGVEEVDFMPVEEPLLQENLTNIISEVDKALGKDEYSNDYTESRHGRRLASYALLEIEKEKFDTIFPALYFTDNVVYCDSVKGKYGIILLIQAQNFEEIDRIIAERIKPLDGVVRIKEVPIIKMFEM